jgi:hypothetical protein
MIEKMEKKRDSREQGLKMMIRSFFKQEFFQSQVVVWLLGLSLAANLINWLILKIFIKAVDFPIIMHYNVYFGVDMLGTWKQTFILPIMGLILFSINGFLSLRFYKYKERIASHLLLMATLMIQLSLIVASLSVIIINY